MDAGDEEEKRIQDEVDDDNDNDADEDGDEDGAVTVMMTSCSSVTVLPRTKEEERAGQQH